MSASESVEETARLFADPGARAAELLCERHPRGRIALTLIDEQLVSRDVTFGELADSARRVAAALMDLGVAPGDRVAGLMGKSIDLLTVMLGTWRLGAVYVPLFTAFAPQAIAMRLEGSGAKVVVTDVVQRPKLDEGVDMPPPADRGWRIVIAGPAPVGCADDQLDALTQQTSRDGTGDAAITGGNGALVHMFTSGTTGKPKGVIHPLSYVAGWQIYLEYALGLTRTDVFWCAADPGWAYGLYAAIVGPLALGRRTILYTGGFDATNTWKLLANCGVTNFAAAPTVYRALRVSGGPPEGTRLEKASSAGEPLTPEVNEWALPTLGIEVHDHFGQTEVGMVLANHHHPSLSRPLKQGSMGRAIPGWKVTILEPDHDRPTRPGATGRLALDASASPLMSFAGYAGGLGHAEKFAGNGRWYLLGDTARADSDGDFFFQARDDDVIITAGYRIGPFEIESVIAQHPAVAECAVIGAPDRARGEVLEAYVVLRAGYPGSDQLAAELQALVKQRYAAHAYPRSVHFLSALPKTASGKIQRYVLRRQRADDCA